MNDRDLPPTTDDLFSECPRFRILVLGRSGVGKTSLIKQVFKIDTIQASNLKSGVSDINEELTSPSNDRFVLHDSQGFEPGEVDNFNTVTGFIDKRVKETHIKDQLHAIWFCIQTPYTGGRVFETGDENFLRRNYKVPIIVVFTQYDRLFSHVKFTSNAAEFQGKSEDMIKSAVEERTDARFQETCVRPLKSYNSKLQWAKVSTMRDYWDTCTALVDKTSNHLVEVNKVWFLSAVAQRVHADLKIDASIKLGMRKYWLDLASSPHFDGRPLRQCLNRILLDILQVWNFSDGKQVLSGSEFEAMVFRLIQDLGDPGSENAGLTSSQEVDAIKETLGRSDSTGQGRGWMNGTYQINALGPTTLVILMGFIVDLTMVLERLFWVIFRQDIQSVSIEHVQEVFNKYIISGERTKIHEAITKYAKQINPKDPDEAHKEVKRLIEANRSVPLYGREGGGAQNTSSGCKGCQIQ